MTLGLLNRNSINLFSHLLLSNSEKESLPVWVCWLRCSLIIALSTAMAARKMWNELFTANYFRSGFHALNAPQSVLVSINIYLLFDGCFITTIPTCNKRTALDTFLLLVAVVTCTILPTLAEFELFFLADKFAQDFRTSNFGLLAQ